MLHTVERFKWTKVILWTTSLYYVTLSIGDKVRIEKHVQFYPSTILYPLAIRYVLKNMCNFSFCYEKTYCTYTVLLFLAHADHCLHPTVPTHQISARQSQTHQISELAARSPSLMQCSRGTREQQAASGESLLNRSQWWLRRVARTTPFSVSQSVCVHLTCAPLWSYDELGILWDDTGPLCWVTNVLGGLQIFFLTPSCFVCELM